MPSPDPGYWVAVSRQGGTWYLSAAEGSTPSGPALPDRRIVMSQKDAESIADTLTDSEGIPWYAEEAK